MASSQQEEVQLWQTVAPIEFSPSVGDRTEAQKILIAARQGAGFAVAGGQISHAIQSRATHVLLDYSQSACAIRYQIDGAWEQLPPIDRETGDAMLYALKQLCLLNPADRRSAQRGAVGGKLVKDKFKIHVQSQGVPTGERVLIRMEPEKVPFDTLADLGMRDRMIATWKEHLNREGSLVMVTAPKGQGLTTSWTVSLQSADRLIRDFQSFEDQDHPEPEIINVNPNFYGGDTELSEHQLLQKMILKEPDVLIFPELPSPESMKLGIDQVEKNDKQIYVRDAAGGAVEGYAKLVGRYAEVASAVAERTSGVLCQKLVRRLCENCKVGFEPPPQLLQQLGIPPGRVSVLYQPFVPPPPEQQVDEQGRPAPIEPCEVCHGRGFYGRVGIFELLQPGDQLKAAVKKTKDVGQLRAVAKQEGHRDLKTEAVMTVARGLTSLDELKRAFASG